MFPMSYRPSTIEEIEQPLFFLVKTVHFTEKKQT